MSHLIIAEKDELITKDLIVGILDSLTTETKGDKWYICFISF